MGKKILTTGNGAAAAAVKAARVDFVAAYPITPQTTISEKLSEFVANGELDANYLAVESEHSALAAVAAASLAGARTFTATSSQGLLYMHEIVHYAAGGRLPIVMVNVNRAVCPPWSLYVDHHDALSQRDTGWIQFYCADTQEIYDTVLQAYRLAESINIPVMVNLDGFLLSHSMMPMEENEQTIVDKFLPPLVPQWTLHPSYGAGTFGNVTPAEHYTPFRKDLMNSLEDSLSFIEDIELQYKRLTGREHGGLIDLYRGDDAEVFLVSMGSMAKEMEMSVDILRDTGVKAAGLRIRVFRPFPGKKLRELLPNGATALVFDRNYGFGSGGGIIFQELKSALYDSGKAITVKGLTCGLGGEDLTAHYMAELAKNLLSGKEGA